MSVRLWRSSSTTRLVVFGLLLGAGLVTPPSSALADTSRLVWPTSGFISQNALEHRATEHVSAIDIANASGGPVVAAAAGTIVTSSVGGNTVCYSQNHNSNG